MDLQCPYCDVKAGINHIHAHMVEAHAEVVETEFDEESGKMRYIIACPLCPLKYQHRVKPRYLKPQFLEEFRHEIAMVAFDQLLYHLAKDHPDEIGFEGELLDEEEPTQ